MIQINPLFITKKLKILDLDVVKQSHGLFLNALPLYRTQPTLDQHQSLSFSIPVSTLAVAAVLPTWYCEGEPG
jgi:hypothetical protein